MAKTISYYEEFNIEKSEKLKAAISALPDFCDDYFVGISLRTSVLTRLNYASDLGIFFDYLIKSLGKFNYIENIRDFSLENLENVERKDIERFLSDISIYKFNDKLLKNGEKGKARKLSSIRALFKYLYNTDAISQNVASKVSMPKMHDKNIVRLNKDEVNALLNSAESASEFESEHRNKYNQNTKIRDSAILYLLLGTGIRVSECVGLDVFDVDLNMKSFIVTRKGGNKDVLYFSDEIRDALSAYISERENLLRLKNINTENALFLSMQNKRISVRAVENVVKKYTATVNPLKSVSPHKLRSTYGTALYRETKDIYVVAEVLGHRDVNTTKKHYAALSEDIKKDAASKVSLKNT